MNIFKGNILLLIACLSFSQIAFSQSKFEPAKFRDSDKIIEKIAFPRKGGDVSYLIPCNILLPLNGRIAGVYCHLKSDDKHAWLFERAVYKALAGAKMSRAMVDGKARSVWLNLMVAFNREGSEKSIELYLNHASEFERYGPTYVDPQRLIPLDPVVSLSNCRRNANIWIEAIVDIEGKTSEIGIHGGKGAENCTTTLLKEYENTLFIPAHYQGQVVSAQFYEPLTTYFESQHFDKMLSRKRPIRVKQTELGRLNKKKKGDKR